MPGWSGVAEVGRHVGALVRVHGGVGVDDTGAVEDVSLEGRISWRSRGGVELMASFVEGTWIGTTHIVKYASGTGGQCVVPKTHRYVGRHLFVPRPS